MSNIPFIDIEGGGGGSDIQLSGPPIATPNYGILSLGGGPFDGVTTGYFAGSANGTAIGVNLPSGSIANALDIQYGGLSAISVTSDRHLQCYSVNVANQLIATWMYPGGTYPNIVIEPSAILLGATGGINTVIAKGGSGQTADLQQWQSSTGSVLAKVDASGNLILTGSTTNVAAISVTNSNPFRSQGTIQSNPEFGVTTASNLPIVLVAGPTMPPLPNSGILARSSASPGASWGHLMVGNAPFDNSTSGFFVGSANGTMIAVNAASGYTGNILDGQVAGVGKVTIDSSGAIAPQNGARITSGVGAPVTPGGINPTAGDVYHRTDTPTVASQRIYVCSVGGATPTWIGIA